MYHRKLRPNVALATLILTLAWVSAPAFAADPTRGGLLYDRWWLVNGAPLPTGDHPLYPPAGQQIGSITYRCKECHGWDYKGAAGAYGAGSAHFTGIGGVFGSVLTGVQMFDIIKNPDGNGTGGTTVNGHDFGSLGLSDADIDDLVIFLQTLVIDTDPFIDANGIFIGDEAQGQVNYTGPGFCVNCHGPDGDAFNFGTPENPEWVGTVAVVNPWEMLHKVRIGNPGTSMFSWLLLGGSDQGAADIGLYAQRNFPTGPDPIPAASTWGLIILATMLLIAGGMLVNRRYSTQGG